MVISSVLQRSFLDINWTRRGELLLMSTIHTYNSVNLAVAVGLSTVLYILMEADYRGDAYVPDLKNSVSCLNTYV